ncbi:MAG: phage holin family protein [Actinomycetota bacterium]|nr:phage holin family protein [Actinomycetota bacterium]
MDRPDALGRSPIEPPTEEREPVEIIRSLLDEVQLLFKKHVELARQELLEALEARLKAAGAGAAAGVLGLFALGFLASALAFGLDVFLPSWVARLIVAVLFAAAAAGAALFARKRLVEPPTAPEATIEALKDDKEWARSRLSREAHDRGRSRGGDSNP